LPVASRVWLSVRTQYLLGNQSEAFNLYHKSLAIAEQLSQSDPTDFESRISIIKLHHALAVVLARERRSSEALQEENIALARVTEYLKMRPEDSEAMVMAEAVRSSLSDLLLCSEGLPCAAGTRLKLSTLIN
jgi:hypothetical protein